MVKAEKWCTKRVFTNDRADFGGHLCGRPGKVQENGKWLCAIHTTDAVAARIAKRNARWAAESAADAARWAKQAERSRMADEHPELLARIATLEARVKDVADEREQTVAALRAQVSTLEQERDDALARIEALLDAGAPPYTAKEVKE